jgi:hypothetical protein
MNLPSEFKDLPEELRKNARAFHVEPTHGGYWCYFSDHRSAGDLQNTPINETLKWILEQISFGHITTQTDEHGDVVCLKIGKACPHEGNSEDEIANQVCWERVALVVAGVVADCRESGSYPKNVGFEKEVWQSATPGFQRRVELHYAMVLSRLLGHVSKKLPKLEMLPILDGAPEDTKAYIAEATRCYLLKLDRACISLCRACLEHTLKNILTEEMENEWQREIEWNKKTCKQPNAMHALIEVCARHGMLTDTKDDAHYIRLKGNEILHLRINLDANSNVAGEVLWKTRRILALIHSGSRAA